jgi:hypothetical protein
MNPAQIRLSDGQMAFVDPQDYDACMEYSWTTTGRNRLHVMTYIPGSGVGRKNRTCLYLHRFIAGRMGIDLSGGMEVDHRDTNPLNNVRTNLRPADRTGQRCNQGPRKDNKLGVKGVCVCPRTGRYRAEIAFKGKRYYLGMFSTLEEASAAYAEAARKYHGEFART